MPQEELDQGTLRTEKQGPEGQAGSVEGGSRPEGIRSAFSPKSR